MVGLATQTSTTLHSIECMQRLAKKYPALINQPAYPCNKATQNLAPPNKRRKKPKLSTPLNFFQIQRIVCTLCHTTITFFPPWHTFCVVVASMICTMSKTGAASFSPLRTRSGTAAGSNNLPIDGFKP
uniref:Uncharacterized protein n=1 Tax=Bursaphelenchus xylophilus TaxID=6326 RepID=A0A1I7SH69_BURXY